MDNGVRNIDIDIHNDGGVVKLCHQNCSSIYSAVDSYPNELQKMATWLAAHPKEILFLDRKTGGVFIFLSVLNAHINARKVIDPYFKDI